MKYLGTGIVAAILAISALSLMWWAWRGRARRDAALAPDAVTLLGDPLQTFNRVYYVATTRAGEPLERIAIPRLKYRGYSTVDIFANGIRIRVDGEHAVDIGRELISGSGEAQMRIDKVVERDGLALVRWTSRGELLESSFRFTDPGQQAEFTSAVESITSPSRPQENV